VGDRRRGRIEAGALRLPCALGRGGVTHAKREGDGATPAGRFLLRRVWLRPGFPLRRAGIPLRFVRPDDGWCDDPAHPRYNRPVRLPFRASHERMWRDDRLYDAVVEIGWNDRPAVRGRGSAIFLHIARPGYRPTEGCVAVSRRDMMRLLPLIGPRTRIVIA
jgi:L,D-peptidoglycan transpeptidase YkuD (ErfK/YbiS/YcfS/YnhG family)